MKYSENNIYLADCYKAIKDIPDNSIDCIYTDIPYLYHLGAGGASELGAILTKKKGELLFISNGIDYSIFDEFKRVLKKINIFIWCSKEQIGDIYSMWGGYNKDMLVWCKTNPTPATHNVWLPDLEYCIHIREKGLGLNDGYDLKSKWYVSAINKKDKDLFEHPTIKPLPLVERHLKHATQEGDVVLDVFAGSGTTLVAAKNTGRKYIGFEIEEKWYNIAFNRLNNIQASGQMTLFTM